MIILKLITSSTDGAVTKSCNNFNVTRLKFIHTEIKSHYITNLYIGRFCYFWGGGLDFFL